MCVVVVNESSHKGLLSKERVHASNMHRPERAERDPGVFYRERAIEERVRGREGSERPEGIY